MTDPTGPQTASSRVLRGGGFNRVARACRSSYRIYFAPANRFDSSGFRAVCLAE